MNNQLFINPDGYYESQSGLLLPKESRKPTAFDFFAGCGGFSLGFIRAGWEIIGMNEIALDAMLTYAVNLCKQPLKMHFDTEERAMEVNKFLEKRVFGTKERELFKTGRFYHKSNKLFFPTLPGTGWILSEELAGNIFPPCRNIFVADIRNLTGEFILEKIGMKKGELKCVLGGPPCQGYSKSGKQNIDDPRNELIFHFARMIVELNPETFVMEEVPDIVNFRTPRGTYVLEEFGQILDEGDFMEFSLFCEAMKFVPKSKRFRKVKSPKSKGKIEATFSKKFSKKNIELKDNSNSKKQPNQLKMEL